MIRDTANFRQRGSHRKFAVTGIRRSNSDKAAAIMIRLNVLARMADNGDLYPRMAANDPGFSPSVAYKALTSAAVQHPLSLIDGDFIFDRESFLRSVLELAKPAGLLQ
jgi:hypothetical protein